MLIKDVLEILNIYKLLKKVLKYFKNCVILINANT